jgi:hypothetical protein
MNVNKIAKIFVEQDEEIVFIIENIMNADNDRVILVIPNVSSITSSAVSLKILSNQIVKTAKSVVLVCDNANAQYLCSKANLSVRSKISDVDKDAWIEAKELKTKLRDEKDKIKKELLGARTPGSDGPVIAEGVVSAKVIDEEEPPKEEVEEIKAITDKPRLKIKIIDINGIKLVAGGDIVESPELLHIERKRINGDDEYEEVEEGKEVETEKHLVGSDISSIYKSKNAVKRKTSFQSRIQPILNFFTSSGWGKKAILGVIVLFFVYAAYSYLFLAEATFTVSVQKDTQPVLHSVTADSDAKEMNATSFTIPATIISKTVTQKADGQPTGKGVTGDYSTGEIEVYNSDDTKDLVLPVGTTLSTTYLGKSLQFVTTAAVTIPKAIVGPTVSVKSGSVNVRAANYGEEFSLKGSTDGVEFKVGSYATSSAYGRRYHDFTVGTSKETLVVSKEDIEALKASLTDAIKTELSNTVKDLISNDDILMRGTEKYTEITFTTSAKEGESVTSTDESPTYTGELKMSITMLKVSKNDLKLMAEEIVRVQRAAEADPNADESSVKISLTDPVVENIKGDDKKATFDLRTNASLIADLDEEKLKELIKGKSLDEAKEILARFNGVKEVKSRYTPSFIPFSMQKVPDNIDKITIQITTYTK